MKAHPLFQSLCPFFVVAILGAAWCPDAARAVGYELEAPNFSGGFGLGTINFNAQYSANDNSPVSVADFSVLGDTPVTFTLSAPAGKAFSVDFTGATGATSMYVRMTPNDVFGSYIGSIASTPTFEGLVGTAPPLNSASADLYGSNVYTSANFGLSPGDSFQFTSVSFDFTVPVSYNEDLSSANARDFYNEIGVSGTFPSDPGGTAFTLVDLAPIPEPSRAVLLGFFGLAMVLRRRR